MPRPVDTLGPHTRTWHQPATLGRPGGLSGKAGSPFPPGPLPECRGLARRNTSLPAPATDAGTAALAWVSKGARHALNWFFSRASQEMVLNHKTPGVGERSGPRPDFPEKWLRRRPGLPRYSNPQEAQVGGRAAAAGETPRGVKAAPEVRAGDGRVGTPRLSRGRPGEAAGVACPPFLSQASGELSRQDSLLGCPRRGAPGRQGAGGHFPPPRPPAGAQHDGQSPWEVRGTGCPTSGLPVRKVGRRGHGGRGSFAVNLGGGKPLKSDCRSAAR